MTYSYIFADAEETILKREDDQGNLAFIPADPLNRDYAEFLSSGSTAAPYVEPPAPPEPTPEEKLARAGLTVDELKGLLGLGG